MRNESVKGFISGILVMILIFTSMSMVGAQSRRVVNANLIYDDITIMLDGAETVLQDLEGRIIEPFIMNGVMYVPISPLARLFGKTSTYDSTNRTLFIGETAVILTEKPEQKIKAGDIIQFGRYDWRVLDVQDGRALILSDKILSIRAYHEPIQEPISWEESDMRQYLNGQFYDSTFSPEEKERIAETTIENLRNSDTTDKIFLLSDREVWQYFENDSERVAARATTGAAYWWWLRTPHGFNFSVGASNLVRTVDDEGTVSWAYVHFTHGGVRPALWLNLE